MLERKVYSGWAYTSNMFEKRDINESIYKELKTKVRYGKDFTEEDKKNFVCIEYIGRYYMNEKYLIVSNPYKLNQDELALMCDKGNLCFGYRNEGNLIVIHID